MSAKYLLPCHNGQTVVVTTADAGRTVACPCGKNVQVPTLRGVQALPRVEVAGTHPAAPAWSSQQGAMFTSGLCLLLVGLIALFMLYQRFRKIETAKPAMNSPMLAQFAREAERADPANTLALWDLLRTSPLEERPLQIWEANRKVANKYTLYMSIAGGVAAIGLGLAIAGPLMRPTPRKPQAKKSREPKASP
jgi:hypothetical protein